MTSKDNTEAASTGKEGAENGSTPPPLSLSEFDDVDVPAAPPTGILSLRTSEEFTRTFNLLYALKAKNEHSERALRLTSAGIKLNAGNPTVWMFRRRIVQVLSSDDPAIWSRELAFTATVLRVSRKNYQAWEHRRFCVEQSGCFDTESAFIDVALYEDAKNYHAWAHRAWLVRCGYTEGELATTEWVIRDDVRNNSAWNHRWVVGGKVGRQGEAEFACEMSGLAPRNESVWNYLLALDRDGVDVSEAQKLAAEYTAKDTGCLPARRFLVLTGARRDQAVQCDALAEQDAVRSEYWAAQAKALRNADNAISSGTG